MAEERLKPSEVGTLANSYKSESRTSENAWLYTHDSDFVSKLDERISNFMCIPYHAALYEAMQVVRYTPGQQFKCHYDFFQKEHSTTNEAVAHFEGVNRLLTFFIYLKNAEEGGETGFCKSVVDPSLYKNGKDCDGIFKAKPNEGDVIFWYNLKPQFSSIKQLLQPEVNSEHSGCPVKQGTKIGANYWIYNKHPSGHALGQQHGFIRG